MQIFADEDWTRRSLHLYLAVVLAFPYYTLLITNGSFDFFGAAQKPGVSGVVFNSMLSHLLQGDFGVDPDAIRLEAFVKDGKTYTYFGVAPALLRLPLLPFKNFAMLDITSLSIVIATCVSAYFKCASILLIKNLTDGSPLRTAVYSIMVISIFLAGPQIQFLKASVYQEIICWAMALNSAFIYCAIRGLFLRAGFTPMLLASMALLAGLALLTRVTAGAGLYVAVALLVLSLASKHLGGGSSGYASYGRAKLRSIISSLTSSRTMTPMLILILFVVLCGVVNYGRWGNPFEVADVHRHIMMSADRLSAVEEHGEFNARRLGYGFLYYFFPINFVLNSNGTFLMGGFGREYYDLLELPPSSFLISDPLMLLLAATFIWTVMRRRHIPGLDVRHAGALLVGFSVPVILILMYYYAAFRFRGEFYPLMEFAAFLGLYVLGQSAETAPDDLKRRYQKALNCAAIVGIFASHLLLVAHKVSPVGNPEPLLSAGWGPAYALFVTLWKSSAQDVW